MSFLLVFGGASRIKDPADIPSLSLRLDASDANTITKDGSDLVSQWDDLTSNNNNATQGTAANQPKYIASAINGLPALQGRHDGSTLSTMTISDSASLDLATGYTAIIVVQRVADTGAEECVFGKYAPNGNFRVGFNTGNDVYHITANSGITGNIGTGVGISLASPTILTARYAGADGADALEIRTRDDTTITEVDGAVSGGILNDGTNFTLFSRTFSSTAFQGYIGEVLFYSRELSDSEVSAIESYLITKWGI